MITCAKKIRMMITEACVYSHNNIINRDYHDKPGIYLVYHAVCVCVCVYVYFVCMVLNSALVKNTFFWEQSFSIVFKTYLTIERLKSQFLITLI